MGTLVFKVYMLIIIVLCGYARVTNAANIKNLMLMTRGGGYTFRALWNVTTPFNDPLNEKADESSPRQLYQGGDFRTAIDPAWGNLDNIFLHSYNALHDGLFYAYLDITGKNMLDIDDWLQNAPVTFSAPFSGLDAPKMIINSQDEVLLQDTFHQTWFSTRHGGGVDPTIMIPVNSSSSFSVSEGVSTEEGCLPDWSFNLGNSYADAINLTPQACLSFCYPQDAALQNGNTCHCADYINPSTTLPHMCDKVCPGDPTYKCGGVNIAYFNRYTGSPDIDERVGLGQTPNSEPLLVVYHEGTYFHEINIGAVLNQGDDFLYVDRISVLAYNETDEQPVLFGFEYRYNLTDVYFEYRLNDQQWWYTDGTIVDLTTLPVKSIIVSYEFDVINSTITLYGPTNASFVGLDYLLVSGVFSPNTTTTTSTPPTTTTEDTTTSSAASTTPAAATSTTTSTYSTTTTEVTTPSSTASITSAATTVYNPTTSPPFTVFSNDTILYNGILYCPCVTTTTNNTNSTYDFAQMIIDLTIDPETVGAEERRYKSASDNRPSAISIGTLGICVIAGVVGSIVYLDSSRLAYEALKCKKNLKKAKQRVSTNRVNSMTSSVHGSVDLEELDIPHILK